ncbi:TPA: ATP-binding protein [Yersinia enterocolitica]|nr:ATP-binding protein [Yersinia enterocolitica]HDL7610210.1 ATP-binding protein [Yersinia enterocolitica]HDL7618356.1 ATP-binding protein [Yersinia enterocolitica]HDL7651736.1 ATP-binding protein [Yersinia enterocolitica]HDL7672655.1 ATP-binding protein [Yersinia enterocolitica]
MANKDREAVQNRIALKRWLNVLKRKDLTYHSYRPRKKGNQKSDYEYIKFPKNFCIYSPEKGKDYQETLSIITDIDNINKNSTTRVLLDFSHTEHLKVASMLILYAAVEDSISNGKTYKIVSLSKELKVNRIIKKSGFIRLCKRNIIPPNFDGEYIPVIASTGGEFRDEIVDFIQQKIYKNKMSAIKESIYGGAIHEAINNVAYHAYPSLNEGNKNKKWWMKCDLADDQLFLAIYDKGVGIPETVLNKLWFGDTLKTTYPELEAKVINELKGEGIAAVDIIRYKFGRVSDAMKIAISMAGDVTGTAASKHGQGSKSIKALVSSNEKGTLWIYSNNGLYKLKNGKVDTIELPKLLPGTLIQWNIKVEYDES